MVSFRTYICVVGIFKSSKAIQLISPPGRAVVAAVRPASRACLYAERARHNVVVAVVAQGPRAQIKWCVTARERVYESVVLLIIFLRFFFFFVKFDGSVFFCRMWRVRGRNEKRKKKRIRANNVRRTHRYIYIMTYAGETEVKKDWRKKNRTQFSKSVNSKSVVPEHFWQLITYIIQFCDNARAI